MLKTAIAYEIWFRILVVHFVALIANSVPIWI